MDSLIRGRTRELTHKVEATVPMNIHNRFDVEVIDSKTGKIRQRAQAENVICSQLWTRLFTPNTYFNYIHYGTGSGTPSTANTSLFTFLGYGTPSTSDDVVAIDRANCIYSLRRKITLSETTAAGSTLTEVGVGYSTTAATLCTHAMLKDANGNQISIAKTDTDIINIYATVYIHWSSSYNAEPIHIIANVVPNYKGFFDYLSGIGTMRPAYATMCRGRNYPTRGTTVSISNTYNATNKTIVSACTRLSAADGNLIHGIRGVMLSCYQPYNDYISPCIYLTAGNSWFAGSNITGEAIGTGNGSTADFSTAFDLPSNATIYVDGVAASGITVDNVPINYNSMGDYFEPITIANGIAYPNAFEGITRGDGQIGPGIYYNPYYQYGIKSYYTSSTRTVSVSNDLANWATVSSSAATVTVPESLRNYKYWQIAEAPSYFASIFTANTLTGKNIHFTTPPASGAVITADYHTPVIAKDTNHVFDLSVTIQLGEYTT